MSCQAKVSFLSTFSFGYFQYFFLKLVYAKPTLQYFLTLYAKPTSILVAMMRSCALPFVLSCQAIISRPSLCPFLQIQIQIVFSANLFCKYFGGMFLKIYLCLFQYSISISRNQSIVVALYTSDRTRISQYASKLKQLSCVLHICVYQFVVTVCWLFMFVCLFLFLLYLFVCCTSCLN